MVSKITYELLKNSDVFKNIPILTLDERWYHLINEKNKTDEIAYWEKQVNELLKKQGRINNDIKDIKKLKKQLINDVVENMEDDDSSRQKQKRMSQNQRLMIVIVKLRIWEASLHCHHMLTHIFILIMYSQQESRAQLTEQEHYLKEFKGGVKLNQI